MSWGGATVGDLIDAGFAEVKTGPFGTQLKASDYVETGTPVINVRNIGFGHVREEKLEFISEETTQRLSSHLLREKDIVFGRKGAVERHAFIRDKQSQWLQGSDCLRLRIVSEEHVLARYLSYAFLTSRHQAWMIQHCSHGATMASLNQDIIRRIPLDLPSLDAQRRIVMILSAYDDLIENNMRRIEILEEMARRLYEEWFVQFRFPGHEDAVFEKMTINNVADVVRGRSYRSAELVEEGRPFVNLKCVNRDGGYRRDGLKYYSGKYKAEQLVTSGDIIMAVTDMTQERRVVARVALVPDLGEQKGVISMDLVRIVPKGGVPPLYLYAFFRWSDFADNVKNHASGANVLHLHPDLVANYDINLPPQEVCRLFEEKVRPAIELVDVLEKKNANLRAQRDLLLPKLISGEIEASEIPMPT